VVVGVTAFFALSTGVGLAIASVLAQIGRDVSELLEAELSATASMPLAREHAAGAEAVEEEQIPFERASLVGSEAREH
jgi:hypothetical protein